MHYDLAWNPTRHEQREGRVDRFGQTAPEVKALLLYGEDNGIDGIVLDVLLRKHERIRRDLGISVPVPPQSDQVLAALLEGILMRGQRAEQLTIDLGMDTAAQALDEQWRSTAEAEKASRTRYAHARIHPDEVQTAVDAARASLGAPASVAGFVRTVLAETGAQLTPTSKGFTADLTLAPVGLVDALGRPPKPVPFVTDLPAPHGTAVLTRTDPRVAAIARYTLDAALDPALPATARPARRCGVITTSEVTAITVALLVTFRTHVHLPGRAGVRAHLAEEARVLAFTGNAKKPMWLGPEQVDALLAARPTANTPSDTATNTAAAILRALPSLQPHLEAQAQAIADELRQAHLSVRQAARGERAGTLSIRGLDVASQLPVDVLGVYVYRPG